MRFKLDENLSRHLKDALCSLGHDVSTVADEGLLGHDDADVVEAAFREQRMVLTLEIELGNVTKYPPGKHPGIIVFRLASLGPRSVNRYVIEFVGQGEVSSLEGCNVIVQPGRTRVRWPSSRPED